MTDIIRTGVIGYGLAGRIFHTAVIEATPGLELAAVVQRTGDDAAKTYPHIQLYRSVEELLADSSVRLIVVATPSPTHFEIAERCLLADRDVVVDKPFTLTSEQAARLARLARERKRVISVYQNRRWDGDFRTVQNVIASGKLGRLATFESHFDRFRPNPRREVWRENGGPGGGTLYDLGSHLIDQTLTLFGKPERIFASVRQDRENAVVDDAFDLTLFYPKLTAYLRATNLACAPGPRFTLHGTQGSFIKYGLDPQEEALKNGAKFEDPDFGHDPEKNWGTLYRENAAPEKIETDVGDYRGYYASVRDALLGKQAVAVPAEHGWRTARIIELARESSKEGRVLAVDFSDEP